MSQITHVSYNFMPPFYTLMLHAECQETRHKTCKCCVTSSDYAPQVSLA